MPVITSCTQLPGIKSSGERPFCCVLKGSGVSGAAYDILLIDKQYRRTPCRGPADHLHIAQHLFGVVHEIGVHPDSIGVGGQMHTIGLNIYQPITLLVEDNIRSDPRTGSGLEGIIRQSDSAEEVRSLGNILSDIGFFLQPLSHLEDVIVAEIEKAR